MRNSPRDSRTPEIKAAVSGSVRDRRRMAKTAKRAWFTIAWPEALAQGDAHIHVPNSDCHITHPKKP
ncbi:hypothetical protein [Litorimonas sp.]|uniref:hypothetical protein n=1 Tax=Litorimonas sp. TaxID=1892381 RepID=UPI003A83AA1A